MSADGPAQVAPQRAELLAALSLAIDLGLGQPMEHMLRSSLIATRLARRLGFDADQYAIAYYSTLVMWVGCHADSHEYSAWFGDDIAVRAASYNVDWSGLPYTRFLLSNLGRGRPALSRIGTAASMAIDARGRLGTLIRSHCSSAALLAERFGLDARVGYCLACTFERWDGRGLPRGARGSEIPIEMRVAQLADVAEVHLRAGGTASAVEVARDRSGTQFDPAIVEVFASHTGELLDGLGDEDAWQAALDIAPDRDHPVSDGELDSLLMALGDFADLKCPFTLGHSRSVADLAASAGQLLGLPEADCARLRRAGHVHDLGRIGVPNSIWEKPGPLSATEWERVRLHPYLTGRILHRVRGLEAEGAIAETHHERQDGSGYARGLAGESLTVPSRLLAAADSYRASREPRPHRPALDHRAAADRLVVESAAGRLDSAATAAVLESAGHPAPRRAARTDGLTAREVEVLRLVAQARSTRDIARTLFISEPTARHHVEHIYSKIGVSNRTGASLYALRHGIATSDDL